MESLYNLKSHERFKEDFLVQVFPFRFLSNKTIEILLHNQTDNKKFQGISNYRSKLDPTTIFTGARTLIKLIDQKELILDPKVFNLMITFKKNCLIV